MGSENTLIIDGRELTFDTGETILQVAQRNGIDIPTLCYLKRAAPTGACRMCLVEIEGGRALAPSCTMPAAKGMVVRTKSPSVLEARRMIIAFLLQSGHHNCAIGSGMDKDWTGFQLEAECYDQGAELCPVHSRCRLQAYAYKYQVDTSDLVRRETKYPLETVNPFIVRDFSRCIMCGRCVQACNDVQVNRAISQGYRGANSKIVAVGDRPLVNSDCVFCGECVQACPVGALVAKSNRFEARPWEVKGVRTTCPYCGVGCQMDLHVKDNRVVEITGAEDTGPNYGSLCVKGRFGYDFIHDPERLTTPLIRENGDFREASWDEALDHIAENFKKIREESGADSIGLLSSARITNEENYLIQKFARAVIGTNNVDHCARL